MVLILITAFMNIGLDMISRRIRTTLRLQTSLDAR